MASTMKLMITTETEDVFELEVHGELEVETLEALCEIETGKKYHRKHGCKVDLILHSHVITIILQGWCRVSCVG